MKSAPTRGDHPRAAAWIGLLLYFLVSAAAFAVVAEDQHYRRVLGWTERVLAPWDHLLLLWTLTAKSLWLLAPVLPVAGVLARRGWTHAAWAVAVVAGLGVFGWLAIDLRVQEATRNHAHYYLAFLSQQNPWEWVGDAGHVLRPLAGIVTVVVLSQGAGAWLFGRLGRDLTARWPRLGGRVGLAGATALYLLAGLGIAPAVQSISRPILLHQLGLALPTRMPLFGDGAEPLDQDEFLRQINAEVRASYRQRFERITTAWSTDETAALPVGPRPHVLMITVESLRHDALDPRWMPRLDAWSRQGLRWERHYAAANTSHLGLFALLYGRHPLVYGLTVRAGVRPQLLVTLRRAGYRTAYFGSGGVRWAGMEQYINEREFDRVVIDTEGGWPERDRRMADRISRLLAESGDRPWFVLAFPASTHFDYRYPPEYERHTPTIAPRAVQFGEFVTLSGVYRMEQFRQGLQNRYRNAVGFMDDLLADLVTRLDLARHVVVITGDHGQSFFEDGAWAHFGPLSEIQTRVPMFMRGPRVPAGVIREATSHVDVLPTLVHLLAGRLVPIAHLHGRDLLAGEGTDQVLLSKPDQPAQAVLVRGERRLDLRIALEAPVLYSQGFVDVNARLDPATSLRGDEVAAWLAAIGEELERLAR